MSQRGQPKKHGKNKRREPSRREEGLLNTREQMVLGQKRAQKAFLNLAEETVTAETFSCLLCYINPDIYEQVVMDRGASGICGYPLCPKEFVDSYGDQVYKIRNNNVYDISQRRNFCSNVCYEASEIVQEQVSLEPLYLRDSLPKHTLEVKIPILEKLQGRYGKMVDIAGGVNIPYMSHAKSKRSFTSFTEVAEDSLRMCAENKEQDLSKEKQSKAEKSKTRNKQGTANSGQSGKSNLPANSAEEGTQEWRRPKEDSGNVESKLFDTRMAVLQIEMAFREWMTFESLRSILGDTYVRGMLENFGANWNDFDTAEGLKLGVEAKAKYIALCRKLDEEERDERSGPDLESHELSSRPKKPLPDYKQLQEDAKKQQLKVVSFLRGQDQFEESSIEESQKAEEEEDLNPSLPLIDSYSQVEWRRSIVLGKLGNYARPFLSMACLDEAQFKRLVGDLVMTFQLSPSNIIFKPGQWNFVTLLLLKMLSIRIPAIKTGMERQEFTKFQETLLSNFNLDFGYPDRFLSYVTEIRHIIRDSIKKDQNKEELDQEALSSNFSKINVNVDKSCEG